MNSTKSSWLVIISMLLHSALAQVDSHLNIISKDNCPPPLIVRDHIGPQNDSQNCFNDCCLACPFSNNFYEVNKLEITYKSFAVLGIISFFLMILLAIFFIVLPSQKQNHLSKLILLPLVLSVMCFEGAEFFTINQRQSQCVDDITPADSRNNAFCATQAFFTLAGSCAIACYSSLLMTHLHLVSVWRIEYITNNIKFFHALIFGGSLSAFIIPYLTHSIQSTNICFISLDAAPAFFYFLFFIYIAFAAHLSTFVYMAHITIKSNQRYSVTSFKRNTIIEAQRKLTYVNAIFKMQWRALLGAILMLIIYVLNWYFYIFGLRVLTGSTLTSDWVIRWVLCLKEGGNQSTCANTIKDSIPSYDYIVTLLFFNRAAGILIFIIFAAKKAVLLEVYDLIRGKKPRDLIRQLSFASESVRGSIRGSVGTHRLNKLSYYVSKKNYKNNDDNVSNMSEGATTLTPSQRTSVSRMGEFVESETSITFSHILPSERNLEQTPTPMRNMRTSITLPGQSRQSILKKADT